MCAKFNFIIPDQPLKRVREIAKQKKSSVAAIINELLFEYVNGLDRKQIANLEKRIEALENEMRKYGTQLATANLQVLQLLETSRCDEKRDEPCLSTCSKGHPPSNSRTCHDRGCENERVYWGDCCGDYSGADGTDGDDGLDDEGPEGISGISGKITRSPA